MLLNRISTVLNVIAQPSIAHSFRTIITITDTKVFEPLLIFRFFF